MRLAVPLFLLIVAATAAATSPSAGFVSAPSSEEEEESKPQSTSNRSLSRRAAAWDEDSSDDDTAWPVVAKVQQATGQYEVASRSSAMDKTCTDDAVIVTQLLSNYDKFRLPGGKNVQVSVEIWVQEVSKIIEITSEFELDIYVTERWTDPNLAFEHLNPCKKNISVDGAEVLKKIWSPAACFVNSKQATIHRSPVANIFLQIYSNGSIWHNFRIKLTGPCSSALRTFPIDQQRCFLFYESFTHNYDSVSMNWIDTVPPITILKENITLPDYVLVDFRADSVMRLYPPGMFNELIATFTFQRLYGFYILQVYVPAYISVFISWVSFSLGANQIPSRTTVGVNSLLSLTFQFGSVVSNLPKTSDVKAIDVWILSAMGFIFASLLELAAVGYLSRGPSTVQYIKCDCRWLCARCPRYWTATKLDKASAFLFPFAFLSFNVWYWFIFLGKVTRGASSSSSLPTSSSFVTSD